MIAKKHFSQHLKEEHVKASCEYCRAEVDEKEMPLHKAVCFQRPKPCAYCGAVLQLELLDGHEEHCGNRTDSCEICGENVRLKDMMGHIDECVDSMHKQSAKLQKKKRPRRKR